MVGYANALLCRAMLSLCNGQVSCVTTSKYLRPFPVLVCRTSTYGSAPAGRDQICNICMRPLYRVRVYNSSSLDYGAVRSFRMPDLVLAVLGYDERQQSYRKAGAVTGLSCPTEAQRIHAQKLAWFIRLRAACRKPGRQLSGWNGDRSFFRMAGLWAF